MKRAGAASGSAPSPAKRPKAARALVSPSTPSPTPSPAPTPALDGSAEDAVLELTGQRAPPQRAVAAPSLEQLCVDALAADIDLAPSVGFLPRAVAERLVTAVFARHRLSPALLRLLTSIDCPVTVLELTLDGDREALAWLRAARGLPGLAQLRVVGAVVPAQAWTDVAGVARALQRVTLDGCANVTDGALAALAGLPQLRALRLRRCPLCTATGLLALATHAARAAAPVRELQLVDCVRVRALPPRLCATLERLLLADQWPLALALFVRPPLPMTASTVAALWPVLRDLQLPDLAPGVLQTDRLPELEQLRLPTDLRTLSLAGARFPALPVQPRHTVLAAAHLTALNLSGTTLTDADVTDVLAPAVGPHLAWLDVRRTRTTSAAVPTYCKWERLEVLLLAHTKVDRIAAEVADRLAALPRLRCLDVRGCPIVDPLNLVLRLHPLVRVRWHDDDGDGETVKASGAATGAGSGGDYDGALRRLPHAPMPATWTELAGFEIATG